MGIIRTLNISDGTCPYVSAEDDGWSRPTCINPLWVGSTVERVHSSPHLRPQEQQSRGLGDLTVERATAEGV